MLFKMGTFAKLSHFSFLFFKKCYVISGVMVPLKLSHEIAHVPFLLGKSSKKERKVNIRTDVSYILFMHYMTPLSTDGPFGYRALDQFFVSDIIIAGICLCDGDHSL